MHILSFTCFQQVSTDSVLSATVITGDMVIQETDKNPSKTLHSSMEYRQEKNMLYIYYIYYDRESAKE